MSLVKQITHYFSAKKDRLIATKHWLNDTDRKRKIKNL